MEARKAAEKRAPNNALDGCVPVATVSESRQDGGASASAARSGNKKVRSEMRGRKRSDEALVTFRPRSEATRR